MLKHYTGDWQKCDDHIDALIAVGVEVKWTKCWRYDFGKDAQKYDDRKWKVLKSQQELEEASWRTRRLQEKWWGIPTWVDIRSYCVITYRIDDEKYPLLSARYKQYCREEDERIRGEMKKEYEAWCEERQRKIDAYLAKYPWKGEPEAYQEGIDFLRINDPDKGEIIVNITGRAV